MRLSCVSQAVGDIDVVQLPHVLVGVGAGPIPWALLGVYSEADQASPAPQELFW